MERDAEPGQFKTAFEAGEFRGRSFLNDLEPDDDV